MQANRLTYDCLTSADLYRYYFLLGCIRTARQQGVDPLVLRLLVSKLADWNEWNRVCRTSSN